MTNLTIDSTLLPAALHIHMEGLDLARRSGENPEFETIVGRGEPATILIVTQHWTIRLPQQFYVMSRTPSPDLDLLAGWARL